MSVDYTITHVSEMSGAIAWMLKSHDIEFNHKSLRMAASNRSCIFFVCLFYDIYHVVCVMIYVMMLQTFVVKQYFSKFQRLGLTDACVDLLLYNFKVLFYLFEFLYIYILI